MKLSWRVELPQLLIVAAMFAVAAYAWPFAPERLPAHWNLQGQVDRWSGKFEGLLALPLTAIGIYLLMIVLPIFDPGRGNYPNFAKAYNAIRISMIVFFAAIYVVSLLNGFGHEVNMATLVLFLTGLLFMVLGNFLGKIRPNWFVGVRTPWTLSSKLSWDKTHRLAGWLFMLMGALFFVEAPVQNAVTLIAMLVIDGLCVVWMIVYSYLVYRHDPHRTSPAGTSPGND